MVGIDTSILKKIGLTKNEITVYITLLKIGSSTVSTIAERSGLYRPYTYDTLERLGEKGLVSSVSKDNKKHFKAAHPSHLVEIEKEKLDELTKTLPQLESFLKLPKEETKVELYAGKKVVRVILKDTVKTLIEKREKEVLVIGVDEKKFMDTDAIGLKQYFNQLRKNKLTERIVAKEGETYLPAPTKTTTYRFLSKEYFSPTSTFIYCNKVALVIFSEPLQGVIIESEMLAHTYRKQFELMWKQSFTK